MCGICAIIAPKGQKAAQSQIEEMTRALQRRGPDAESFFLQDNIALGHRRLSIIDLETGNQPIFNEDKSVVVILNGEIYNYQDLQRELTATGHRFQTQSDTEILVHGYEEWGIDSLLLRIEGMFAFVLHNSKLNQTYIARDKFGEKPLYYGKHDQTYYFASELKALQTQSFSREISKEGLNLFLSLSYIPAPFSIYQSICKLEQGHYLCFEDHSEMIDKTYYSLEDHIQPTEMSFEEAKEELFNKLSASVKNRMLSDVPVGAFLSGGIDSSIIVGLMSKYSKTPIHTFSIGFKEKEYDESERAQLIAEKFNTKHTLHYLNYADVLDILDDIILYFDEPFGDSSAIPSYYVAKMASEKVKVVLTGDCADELFGGYEKYLGSYYAKRYQRIPKVLRCLFEKTLPFIPRNSHTNTYLRKIKKVIRFSALSGFESDYNYMCIGCSDKERKNLLKLENYLEIKNIIKQKQERYWADDELNRYMFSDILTVLEGDMLPKVDRVCMMNSLESRPPFLDSKLVEFALSLPSSFKIKGKVKKHIVKEAFHSLLPKMTFAYRKSGFDVPIGDWFKSPLKNELLTLLSSESIEQHGLFNAETIHKMVEEHLSNKEDHSSILWNLFVFQKWYAHTTTPNNL